MPSENVKTWLIFVVVMAAIGVVLTIVLTLVHVAQQNGNRNTSQNQIYRLACLEAGGTYVQYPNTADKIAPLCLYPNRSK